MNGWLRDGILCNASCAHHSGPVKPQWKGCGPVKALRHPLYCLLHHFHGWCAMHGHMGSPKLGNDCWWKCCMRCTPIGRVACGPAGSTHLICFSNLLEGLLSPRLFIHILHEQRGRALKGSRWSYRTEGQSTGLLQSSRRPPLFSFSTHWVILPGFLTICLLNCLLVCILRHAQSAVVVTCCTYNYAEAPAATLWPSWHLGCSALGRDCWPTACPGVAFQAFGIHVCSHSSLVACEPSVLADG